MITDEQIAQKTREYYKVCVKEMLTMASAMMDPHSSNKEEWGLRSLAVMGAMITLSPVTTQVCKNAGMTKSMIQHFVEVYADMLPSVLAEIQKENPSLALQTESQNVQS